MKNTSRLPIRTTVILSGLLGLIAALPASGEDKTQEPREPQQGLRTQSAGTIGKTLATAIAPDEVGLAQALDVRIDQMDRSADPEVRARFQKTLGRVLSAAGSDAQRGRLLEAFQSWSRQYPRGSGPEGSARFPAYISWLAEAQGRLAADQIRQATQPERFHKTAEPVGADPTRLEQKDLPYAKAIELQWTRKLYAPIEPGCDKVIDLRWGKKQYPQLERKKRVETGSDASAAP